MMYDKMVDGFRALRLLIDNRQDKGMSQYVRKAKRGSKLESAFASTTDL